MRIQHEEGGLESCTLRFYNNLTTDLYFRRDNDGENWAASYDVAIEGKHLTLTSKNDAAEVSKYTSCTIPEEVRTGCEVVVKSAEAGL